MKQTEHHDGDDPYCFRRADNEERWSFVRQHLGDDHETLLDLGCAEGYFTNAAAEYGLDATGIETKEARYEYAESAFGDRDGVAFQRRLVTPENVSELPSADVALVLTVQHHWVGAFGVDAATLMLETVGRKTDLLCYEPPGTRFLTPEAPIDPEDSVDRYREYLADLFGDSATVLDVELFPHVNEGTYADRKDPLFVVDTEDVG